MAWPYAVYTDPTFAATVLQAAAASAHANGTLPDIAAIANAYQYSAAAAAAAAGPSYFHGAAGTGGGGGDYGKFQPQHYVGPVPPPPGPGPPTHSLQQMMKKPFGPFVGHHHHHHHHQFAATEVSATECSNGHHHAVTATGYDAAKTTAATDPKATTPMATVDNNKTSSSSSSSAADAADFTGAAAGTSCKCGIVDCVLTTNGKPVNGNNGSGGMGASTPPATVDRLPVPPLQQPPTSVQSFFMTSGASETGREDVQSAECSLAVHKHVYHKEYAKNKLFQPYKPDVTTAKLNL